MLATLSHSPLVSVQDEGLVAALGAWVRDRDRDGIRVVRRAQNLDRLLYCSGFGSVRREQDLRYLLRNPRLGAAGEQNLSGLLYDGTVT